MAAFLKEQLYVLFFAVCTGILIAMVFHALYLKRMIIPTGSFIRGLEDLLCGITAMVIVFLSLYYGNSGQLRIFYFVGIALGFVLYKFTAGKMLEWLVTLLKLGVKKVFSLFYTLFLKGKK